MQYSETEKQRGAVMIIAPAMCLVVLLFAAFALDIGRMCLNRARLQKGLDASSIATARYLRQLDGSDADQLAVAAAGGRAILDANLEHSQLVLNPDQPPSFYFSDDEVPVVFVQANLPTSLFFGRLLGHQDGSIELRRSAAAKTREVAVSFVLDQSSSMCDERTPNSTSSNCPRMVETRIAAVDFIQNLNPILDYVGVTSFGTFAAGIVPQRLSTKSGPPIPPIAYPMRSTHFAIDDVEKAINSVQVLPDNAPRGYSGYWEPLGWTNAEMGLTGGNAQFNNLTAAQREEVLKVIVFLTDGSPTSRGDGKALTGVTDRANFDAAIVAADRIRAEGTLIYTIVVGGVADDRTNDPYQISAPSNQIRTIAMRRISNDRVGGTGGRPDPEFNTVNAQIPSFAELAARGDRMGKLFHAPTPNDLQFAVRQVMRDIEAVLIH